MTTQDMLWLVVVWTTGLVVVAYFVSSAAFYRRKAAEYRRVARLERTRSVWAHARLALFDLVRHGKLDPRSATFREFYELQTVILRSPDQYEEIAMELNDKDMVSSRPGRKAPWRSEIRDWPPGMGEVLQYMIDGFEALQKCQPTGKDQVFILDENRVPSHVAQLATTHALPVITVSVQGIFSEAKNRMTAVRRTIPSKDDHSNNDFRFAAQA
jgi:hypothetical protein